MAGCKVIRGGALRGGCGVESRAEVCVGRSRDVAGGGCWEGWKVVDVVDDWTSTFAEGKLCLADRFPPSSGPIREESSGSL